MTLGISSGALFVAIREAVTTRGGRVGARLLALIGVAYVGAAVFLPDSAAGFAAPAPVAPSVAGYLHGVCGIIVIATSPIAFTLLGRSLTRQAGWHGLVQRVRRIAYLPWLGLISFGASLIALTFSSPQAREWMFAVVLVSVSNRLLIVSYCAWLMVMSRSAFQARQAAKT